MNHMDLLTGYVDISPVFGVTSPDYRVFAVRDKEVCFDRYYLYLFQAGYKDKIFYAFGQGSSQLGRWRFPTDEFNSFEFPLPPMVEQKEIVAFLDYETAKIDALLVEQRRLLELLSEKRQAALSQAVTKGLNSEVAMKNSGVAWLGKVPVHWELMPLKRDMVFLTSGSRGWADHYSEDGALFIRIGNLTREGIGLDLSDIQRVSVPEGTEGERTRVQPGDVLFSITAYLGSVAVVSEHLEPAYVSQHVALVRLRRQRLLPKWAAYVALSIVGKTYLEMQGYGGTKIQLSLDDVANLPMTVPDISEQAEIIKFLDQQNARFDALAAEAESAIALLQTKNGANFRCCHRQDRRAWAGGGSPGRGGGRMSDLHKEINLENEISAYLAANGWLYSAGDATSYDRGRAVFTADVIAWLQATQTQAWEALSKNHGPANGRSGSRSLARCIESAGHARRVATWCRDYRLTPAVSTGAIQTCVSNESRDSGEVRSQSAADRAASALFSA